MIGNQISETLSHSKDYAELTFKYYKLKVFVLLSGLLTSTIKMMVVGLFLLLATLFFSIALSMYLGEVLDNPILGFVLVGAIFLVVVLILFPFRKKLENKIVQNLSKKFFEDDD